MRHISDDELTLLYYGEHDDPALAARVANSAELSDRFDALCAELKLADAYQPPDREEDYGAEVWQRISPQLAVEHQESGSRFKAWLSAIGQPRFSLAGVLSIALVALLAFMLGRNGGPTSATAPPGPPSESVAALTAIDAERLLTSSISGHLEQVDLVLTQFANSSESSTNEAAWATDMLVANRLYRRAAAARGDRKLSAFLAGLEPLLIELAYEAHAGSTTTRDRMQKEIRDGLLFRVRVMNNQLKKVEISI